MKVSQTKAKFTPVTITLETMSELILFAKLLGGASQSVIEDLTGVNIPHDRIFEELKDLVGDAEYKNLPYLVIEIEK